MRKEKEKVTFSFYYEIRNRLRQDRRYQLLLSGYASDMSSVRSLRKFHAADLIEPPMALLATHYTSENMWKGGLRKFLELNAQRYSGWQERDRLLNYMVGKFIVTELAECGNDSIKGGTLSPDSIIKWTGFKGDNFLEIRENSVLGVSAAFGGFSTQFSQELLGNTISESMRVCNRHGEMIYQKQWKRPTTLMQRIAGLPASFGSNSIAGIRERVRAVLSSIGWRYRFKWAFERDCEIYLQIASETVMESPNPMGDDALTT